MRPLPQSNGKKFKATRIVVVALLTAGAGMPGCGGGGAATPPSSPPPSIQVSVTTTSASVMLGNSMTFRATVTNTTDTGVSWSVNGTAGGNATEGIISPEGVYTAPPDLPSPATVQITATSHADATKSGSVSETITSDITLAMAPNPASVELGATQGFQATVTSSGRPDTTVRWSVSGVACARGCGTVDSNGTYTAPQTLPLPASVKLTAQSVADPSNQVSMPVAITSNFSLQLSAPSSVPVGGTATIVATLTPVPGSNPSPVVSWSLSGAGCSGASCGTLSVVTTQSAGGSSIADSATYTAPASAPSPNTVTVTVTPQADPTKKAQTTLAIQPGVSVSVSPATATLAANHRETLSVRVNGTSNAGVVWSVNGIAGSNATFGQICVGGSNPCQTVTSTSAPQVDYLAPGAIPAPNPVSATAVSAADPTKSASTQITVINHVLVSVLPASVTLAPQAVQGFAASVLGTSNQSVVWQVQGTARTTNCTSALECTAPVTATDVAAAGNVSIQIQNPDGTKSNVVSLVVAAPNASDEVIALSSAAPNATGKDIVVVDPTTAGVSVAGHDLDLNVAALGVFSTANNSCTLGGN